MSQEAQKILETLEKDPPVTRFSEHELCKCLYCGRSYRKGDILANVAFCPVCGGTYFGARRAEKALEESDMQNWSAEYIRQWLEVLPSGAGWRLSLRGYLRAKTGETK